MILSPAKDETVALHISDQKKGRIQVGLSWDTGTETIERGFLFFKKKEQIKVTYDLDIFCCTFDKSKNFLDKVTPENAYLMDDSGQINHSGDNRTGRVGGDDEFVSANMALLKDNVYALAYFATVNDGRQFNSIANPVMRVADGKTDESQLLVEISKLPENNNDAFLFAIIHRDESKESGWALKNISRFYDDETIEDWTEVIKEFID